MAPLCKHCPDYPETERVTDVPANSLKDHVFGEMTARKFHP